MFVSVIIPTYNRRDILRETIFSLCSQTYPPDQYEIVIADDGSVDNTREMIAAVPAPCPIRYEWQPNAGVNAARNRGTRLARGPLLLFLDDDMLANPGLVTAHVESRRHCEKLVVKGRVVWQPLGDWDLFARFTHSDNDLNERPGRNGFISFFSVFAGHFSIHKTDALQVGPWEERWRDYGFFDLDFMYRAHRAGLRMQYNPRALTYHRDYASSLERYCNRAQIAANRAATELFVKHPELETQMAMFRDKGYVRWRHDPFRLILRKLARTVMIWPPALCMLEGITKTTERLYPSPAVLRPLYRWVVGSYICLGYREGLKSLHG